MRKITIAILSVIISCQASFAQSSASWVWGIADTAGISAGNTANTQHVAAASGSKVLWAMLQDRAVSYSPFDFGSYRLTEYNNTGVAGTQSVINGKLYVAYVKPDDAGNWYILGQYYDTINFPGGPTLINPAPTSSDKYFIAKLNAGSLTCAWAQPLSYGDAFTVTPGGLYIPIDTASATIISKFDLATGNRTDIFSQPFSSHTSSIAVDGTGSIYLAGSCAFGGINFNGHSVSTTSIPYPVYLVKYNAAGTYQWNYLMSDITCPDRQLTLASDNIIYYSGKIFDSFTIGGFFVHQPRWVYDYLVSRLDSSGNILWLKQQKDTVEGDAAADNNYHAIAMADSTISVYAQIRGYIDWGNGTVTSNGTYQNAAVINYAYSDGRVNWVKPIVANTVFANNIGTNGTDIWVTGKVYDTVEYHLDGISVPIVPITYTPYLAMLHTTRAATGVKSIVQNENQFQIMPVPATTRLNIMMPANITGNVRIRLCDVSGREVFEEALIATSAAQIDVSKYNRGLYFIEISGGGYRTVKKLVLE